MITAGCDVGSLTSKAVILSGNRIVAKVIERSRRSPEESAKRVMDAALQAAGLGIDDIRYCVGTGYGRKGISFVNEAVSEITCHGKGARWLVPTANTVIDIGGQDAKAIRLDDNGRVDKFLANDKCAAGTGRFLEVMAKLLGLSLDEMGKLSAKSKQPVTMASTCTVWAQADVIQHINDGGSIEDLAAGVNNAMAFRVATLANAVKARREVCMTGGVAKNQGVVKALEKQIGMRIVTIRKSDPQLAGAIGAALLAAEKANGGGK
ncbi:MAG: acyl-CoA dehydratase activase [Desulfatibacillaceae bacterium]